MSQLPVAYVSEIHPVAPAGARDGMGIRTLGELVAELRAAEVRSPSTASLIEARFFAEDLQRAALFVLGSCALRDLGGWSETLAAAGLSSVAGCSVAELEAATPALAREDAPLLTGHGVVLASRGSTGEPLVDLPLEELRAELTESRRRLSKLVGYPVRILLPEPTAFGRAVDGLVLEEAKRAGYRLVLQPGRGISEAAEQGDEALTTLQYRTIRTAHSAEHLRDWIVGQGLARGLAKLRDLADRPARIFSRFGFDA